MDLALTVLAIYLLVGACIAVGLWQGFRDVGHRLRYRDAALLLGLLLTYPVALPLTALVLYCTER